MALHRFNVLIAAVAVAAWGCKTPDKSNTDSADARPSTRADDPVDEGPQDDHDDPGDEGRQDDHDDPKLDQIELPDGFAIHTFARVPGARSMVRAADGTVFVGTRDEGKVYAVVDHDNDGRADAVKTIADGLNMPNGVALHGGDLFVAEIDKIWRYPDIGAHLDAPPPPRLVSDAFPDDQHHGWKYIRFGPDDKLYVPVGAPCNICEPDFERYANLQRMDPDGSNRQVVARGIRNTVGFDWNPDTGVLWFTDNGRDQLGDNRPADELNRAPTVGLNFGYPYCHAGDIADPEFGGQRPCSDFVAPAQKLGAHVAALGVQFYDGQMFPDAYKNRIFIAEHGSWNRSTKIGYRVMMVQHDGADVTAIDPFATGWLQGQSAWGRPVDLEVLADGSMLVSDDAGGKIYRITYTR